MSSTARVCSATSKLHDGSDGTVGAGAQSGVMPRPTQATAGRHFFHRRQTVTVKQLKSGEFELVYRERYGNKPDPFLNARKQLSMRARMAVALIEKWGMVAAIPDGEDSSGRQKLRMMKPKEMVERAVDV